ncbi:hypothetical protein [Nonomuraea sp. LPB2021202275-12-8]|uniref:hypothetical protein n=1 Tax=Nonomuraea sp. LPB2021202275-12-8 TaxID=3120159 RepID=UPI00300CCE46
MPTDPTAITARAEALHSDARQLAACADRLRHVETTLAAGGVAPPWLREAVNAYLTACTTAAADLDKAAARLWHYAEGAR